MTFVGKQAAFGPLLVDSSVSQQRDLGKNIWNTQFLAHTHVYILYQNKMNKIRNRLYLIHFFFHCLGTSTNTINYLPFSQFVYGLEELKQLYIYIYIYIYIYQPYLKKMVSIEYNNPLPHGFFFSYCGVITYSLD